VKVYEQLPVAGIFGTGLEVSYRVVRGLQANGNLSYRLGRGKDGLRLPLMQPFSYGLTAVYKAGTFTADAGVQGAAAYTNYNPEFGEMPAGAYYIVNLALSKGITFGKHQIALKGGVENLLDRYYTTFSDWNRIPRMGRNLFVNVVYSF
jgi:iron complex outermembrane receptor protein